MRGKDQRVPKAWSSFCIVLLLCLGAAITLVSHQSDFATAQTDNLLSETTIRDAIIGRVDLSEFEREQLDFNQDGQLDVADLVMFLKQIEPIPKAAFESYTSRTTEGSETAAVTAFFSRAFTGTLNYSLGTVTTATEGTDFASLGGTVSVNGTSVDISITLVDDLDLEAMETVELVLEEGTGYEIGTRSNHTLYIDENDSTWHGTMALQQRAMGFALTIRRDGSTAEADLRGYDTGIIPESDTPDAGWPMQNLEISENSFLAHIENIPVPQEQTSRLGTTFTRSLTFATVQGKDDTILDTQSEIEGDITMTLVPDSAAFAHLQRTVSGTFHMVKAPVQSNVPEAALHEAQ